MATYNDGETTTCTFQWKIENVGHSWWLKEREPIASPTFVLDGLEDTKWSLWLYLKGSQEAEMEEDEILVRLQRETDCTGPEYVKVKYRLEFLDVEGSILGKRTSVESFKKGQTAFSTYLESQEQGFDREHLFPEDTLTVQCTLQKTEKEIAKEGLVKSKSKHLYARTLFKVIRKSLDWRIEKFSTLEPGVRKKFKSDLIEFDLVLNGDFLKRLDIDVISLDDCLKYISFDTSIMDSEGRKKSCGIKRYTVGDNFQKGVMSPMQYFSTQFLENKNHYFPNDVLPLNFGAVLSTVEHSYCSYNITKGAGQKKYENMEILTNNFKSMYFDQLLSDTELRTPTKTFPAHKNILSARSLVFRRMFSHDMKEKNSESVNIDDLEDDTVQRMLLFMYTGFLEDLQFESASKLFEAADIYKILSLKSHCSSFLKENLSPANACHVLLLADQHQDGDLKDAVQLYILENDEVFKSLEWKLFMDTHLKLAADIMYKKLNRDEI